MYENHIADISLAPEGEKKIRWAAGHMPVLAAIAEDFRETKPLTGLRVALSVHLEAKTAWLCRVMEMGGAEMHVAGSNPLSTQDDVAAALAAKGPSTILNAEIIDRGYVAVEQQLSALGANIERK